MNNYLPPALIIDDDPMICRVVGLHLANRFQILTAYDGKSALAMVEQACPRVVVMDWIMPGLHGVDLLHALHERCPDLPIVVMTGEADLEKAVASVGLAVAFLAKPMMRGELLEAVGRAAADPMVGSFGEVRLDRDRLAVSVRGKPFVELTPDEYRVLALLGSRQGEVVSTEEIADVASNGRADPEEASEAAQWAVFPLRTKMTANVGDPQYILTVPGRGFRFWGWPALAPRG
ncbi:MAG: response regulator transcription factor [Deltaproteobacteria bacterium]|nr:response regulator transcription factor [Deltaproteobacteria bacterium]